MGLCTEVLNSSMIKEAFIRKNIINFWISVQGPCFFFRMYKIIVKIYQMEFIQNVDHLQLIRNYIKVLSVPYPFFWGGGAYCYVYQCSLFYSEGKIIEIVHAFFDVLSIFKLWVKKPPRSPLISKNVILHSLQNRGAMLLYKRYLSILPD